MAAKGYFQLVAEEGKMWLQVFPPEDEGELFAVEDVIRYLELISFPGYDAVALEQYLKRGEFDGMFMLYDGEIVPEPEKCVVTIQGKGERALARFYPPTTGGASLTEADIISDLQRAGICHGIHKKAMEHFLTHHEYERLYHCGGYTSSSGT